MVQSGTPVWRPEGPQDGTWAPPTPSLPAPTGPPVVGVPPPVPAVVTRQDGFPMAPPFAYRSEARPGPGYSRKTNVFAVLALVLGIPGVVLLGVIFGHIALSQIRRTGEQGRGLAVAGLVLSYGWLAVSLLVVLSGL